MEIKRYIITDQWFYIDTETYKMDTWGDYSQDGIEIKDCGYYCEAFLTSYGGSSELNNEYNLEESIGKVIWSSDKPLEPLDKEHFGIDLESIFTKENIENGN